MSRVVTDDQGRLLVMPEPWLTDREAELILMGGIICDDETLTEARGVVYALGRKT